MHRQRNRHFCKNPNRARPEVLSGLDVGAVKLFERVVDRVDHKRQEVIDHTENERPLSERNAKKIKERDGREGADEHVDPHWEYEQHHRDLRTVEFRVAEYPCRRIADKKT